MRARNSFPKRNFGRAHVFGVLVTGPVCPATLNRVPGRATGFPAAAALAYAKTKYVIRPSRVRRAERGKLKNEAIRNSRQRLDFNRPIHLGHVLCGRHGHPSLTRSPLGLERLGFPPYFLTLIVGDNREWPLPSNLCATFLALSYGFHPARGVPPFPPRGHAPGPVSNRSL